MTNSNTITNKQKACIHAMLNKLGLSNIKEDIIFQFTNGRSTSMRDMTAEEGRALIQWLKSKDPEEQKAEAVRRTIISMAHELGYRKRGTAKVDMEKLDAWCVKYGKFKKKLNQHNVKELNELKWQFGQYHSKFIRDY